MIYDHRFTLLEMMNILDFGKEIRSNARYIALMPVVAWILFLIFKCGWESPKRKEQTSHVNLIPSSWDSIQWWMPKPHSYEEILATISDVKNLLDTLQPLQWRPIFEDIWWDSMLVLESIGDGPRHLFAPFFDEESDSAEVIVFTPQDHPQQKYIFVCSGQEIDKLRDFFDTYLLSSEFDYNTLQGLMRDILVLLWQTIRWHSTPN